MHAKHTRNQLIDALVAENRAYQSAVDMVDEAACHRLGINRTDSRCLDLLDRDGPVTAGRLAQATGLSAGAATGAVDRLERSGLARRSHDTKDRRRVLVDATPRARRVVGELYGELAKEGYARLRRYSTDELETIVRFMREARELNEQQAARLRQG